MAANDFMTLSVDGTDIWEDVKYAQYTESLDDLDVLTATIRVGNTKDKLWKTLVPGVPFKVTLQPEKGKEFLGEGDIVAVEYKTDADGMVVKITGLETLHRLSYGAPAATLWLGKHDKIVKDIAKNYGLKGKADAVATTESYELQYNVSDALFIKQLCQKYNYYARVVGKDLLYKKRVGEGALSLAWQDEGILGGRLKANLHGVVTKVSAFGYDYLTMDGKTAPLKGEAKALAPAPKGDIGYKTAKTNFKEIELVLNNTGLETPKALEAAAKAEFEARAMRFVTGTLRASGNGGATSGKKLTVKDGEWPFNGDFLIRQTRHVYDRTGYHTYIEFCSAALPKAT